MTYALELNPRPSGVYTRALRIVNLRLTSRVPKASIVTYTCDQTRRSVHKYLIAWNH